MIDLNLPELPVTSDMTYELYFIAHNPELRKAIWTTMFNLGYTRSQINWTEHCKGRHTSNCIEVEKDVFNCTNSEGKSYHPILDKYNQIQQILTASGTVNVNFA